jgi:hypothetical protein
MVGHRGSLWHVSDEMNPDGESTVDLYKPGSWAILRASFESEGPLRPDAHLVSLPTIASEIREPSKEYCQMLQGALDVGEVGTMSEMCSTLANQRSA